MKLTTLSLLLLTTLTLANPLPPLTSPARRQTSLARIISASLSGPGCPANTYTTDISLDAQAITIGYDVYQTLVGPGAPPADREKNCDITLTLNYPLGCTSATLSASYHGFAQLEPGVTGTFAVQYNISPGSLSGDGSSPGPAVVSSVGFGGNGNVYTKVDEPIVARVNVQGQGQRNVQFVVRSRAFVQAVNNSVGGTLTSDDVTVEIVSQGGC